MMRYYFLILLYFLNLIILKSQGENDNWIFGNGCNVSFASGNPVVLPPLTSLMTKEGCTSVSDKDGKLLFYSDGVNIWNADHTLMPGGIDLMGNPSSTSSCVIVPFPKHPGMYYVFCVESNGKSNPQVTYNVVNLNLNSGKGAVIVKNRVMLSSSDEKIAVTRHCNGYDFWIVVHQAYSGFYHAFLLSQNGLSASSVKSYLHESNGSMADIGFLKFSPEGKYLADARCLSKKFLIHQFDKKTGIIQALAVDKASGTLWQSGQTFYGIAFSPNSSKVYTTALDLGYVYQYDLQLDSSEIASNRKLVYAFSNRLGAMQLAKDNRIYFTNGYNSPYLHCIDSPELDVSNCGLVKYKIRLNTISQLGLPTYVEAPEKYFSLGKDNMIVQSGYRLDARIKGARYMWSTGDTTQYITVRKSGSYWVKVLSVEDCALLTDTIWLEFPYDDFKVTNYSKRHYELCSGDSLVLPPFMADTNFVSYNWVASGQEDGLPEMGNGNIPGFKTKQVEFDDSFKITVMTDRLGIPGDTLVVFVKVFAQTNLLLPSDLNVCELSSVNIDSIKTLPSGRNIYWTHASQTIGLASSGQGQVSTFKAMEQSRTINDTFLVHVKHSVCPEVKGQFFLTVFDKKHEQDISVDYCSGDSVFGEQVLSGLASDKLRWYKRSNNIPLPDSGSLVFPDFSWPLFHQNEKAGFTLTVASEYCGFDTMELQMNVTARPILKAYSSDTLKQCGGDKTVLPLVEFVTLQQEKYWYTSANYAGLPKSGTGEFPVAISMKDSVNQYTRIKLHSKYGRCIGDSALFILMTKAIPESKIHPNLWFCEENRVPEFHFKKQNKAHKVNWKMTGETMPGYPQSGSDVMPSFYLPNIDNTMKSVVTYQAELDACFGQERQFEFKAISRPEASFYYDSMQHVQDVYLINTGRNYQHSKWYFGDGDSSLDRDPVHAYSFNKAFLAIQILSNGFCSDTFLREVFVNLQSYNQIPTAFSPDQNDMNEGFKVFNASGNARFSVFNAWGEMLYSTADNLAWDGTYKGLPCQQGVYLYVAELVDRTGDAKQFRGSVTLLR